MNLQTAPRGSLALPASTSTDAPRRRPVIVINTFVVKPGQIDAFIALQDSARARFAGLVPGLRGSRMHRALDGRTAVLMTAFDSLDDQKALLASELFAAHREQLLPLIEQASPGAYEIAYEAGDF